MTEREEITSKRTQKPSTQRTQTHTGARSVLTSVPLPSWASKEPFGQQFDRSAAYAGAYGLNFGVAYLILGRFTRSLRVRLGFGLGFSLPVAMMADSYARGALRGGDGDLLLEMAKERFAR